MESSYEIDEMPALDIRSTGYNIDETCGSLGYAGSADGSQVKGLPTASGPLQDTI